MKLKVSSLPWPVRQPLERAIARTIENRIRATGLIPIDEVSPSDVFVAGYPKSGNTWMQHLLAGIVYGVDLELCTDRLVLELVPDVHTCRYYRRYGEVMPFKTHDLPQAHHRRVVYLLRDGRDAMVSYWHHLRVLQDDNLELATLIQNAGELPFGKWHDHVAKWLANPYSAEMMTLKYEDLLQEPITELQRLCEFLQLKRPESFLAEVVEKASFKKMREREAKTGWTAAEWPQDRFFVRRGIQGSFKDEMPAGVLERFLLEGKSTLQRFGYIP